MKQTSTRIELDKSNSKRLGRLDRSNTSHPFTTTRSSLRIFDLLLLSLYQLLLLILLLLLSISTAFLSTMDMIRSLVFAQPANLTTLPSKTTVTVKEELHPNTSNKRKSDASEEDVLAALRALRQPYEILPQEIRDLGAETLEEAIARSRADRAATASAKNNVSVTVLEGSSAALPPRVTPATATPDFVPFNEPVPLSGPRSGEQIGILNNLCQKRAMRAEFVFEQIGNKHTASLKLGHVLLKPEYEMTYDSKKEVKEVLARKGVELLKQWAKEEAELQQEMDEIHGRKTVVTQKRAPGEAEENWVGILQGKLFVHSSLLLGDQHEEYRTSLT